MHNMKRKKAVCTSGQSLMEYGLILTLILIVTAATMGQMGVTISQMFTNFTSAGFATTP
jgi:Flp pilus assembly pilin Flp